MSLNIESENKTKKTINSSTISSFLCCLAKVSKKSEKICNIYFFKLLHMVLIKSDQHMQYISISMIYMRTVFYDVCETIV